MKAAVVLAGVLLTLLPVKAEPQPSFDLEKAIDRADFVGVVDVVADEVVDHGRQRTETPLLVKHRLRGPVTSPELHLVGRPGDSRSLVGESWLRPGMTLLAFLATTDEGEWVLADRWYGLIRISGAAPAIVPGDGADNVELAAACVTYIRASLKDPDVAVQRSALEALLELRVGEAGPEAVRLSLSQDPVVAARGLAVRMLSGDLNALPRAIEMMETPGLLSDREVLALGRAIQTLSLPVAQLNQLLMTAENPLWRKLVALRVVDHHDASSNEALIHCLSYPDPDTNRVCIGGLEIMTRGRVSEESSQDVPAAIRAWQAWWEEHKAKD